MPGVEVEDPVQKFLKRKEENSKKKRVNNASLRAGSPMYYYCKYCGAEDIKPECFNPRTDPIKDPCDACRELIEKGLMPKS